MPAINFSIVGDLEVPCPPLEVQNEIVRIFRQFYRDRSRARSRARARRKHTNTIEINFSPFKEVHIWNK